MLDTMPYADLLAIYNAIAEKPVARFDTRSNGARRTDALLEARGLTLAEAALLAEVILPDDDNREVPPSNDEAIRPTADNVQPVVSPTTDEGTNPHGMEVHRSADPIEAGATTTFQVDPMIAPSVATFILEMTRPSRPAYLTAFLKQLTSNDDAPTTATKREGSMTPSQRKIVELCSRPEGATGKELAEGCGWPSIAARATCRKLADHFGYDLQESPKVNGRGISFRMVAKAAAEERP